ELLLRGPQTEGELRTHASRMEPVDDLEQLRQALRPMVERKLIVMLGPEGRRGTLIAHGFHSPEELEALRGQARAAESAPPLPAGQATARTDMRMTVQAELQQARQDIADLQARLRQVEEAVAELRAALGEPGA